MKSLWENPNIVAKLIMKSDKKDLKYNIAPLIANNFYENVLSSNFIEDHLLYVIGLVLKDEINNLKNKNDIEKFLEDTPCAILLEQLKLKQDVQTYFNTIMYKIVKNLEEKYSNFEFNFSVKVIEEDFIQTKKEMESEYKKTGRKMKVIASNFFKKSYDEFSSSKSGGKDDDDNENFNKKYVPSLTKEEYKKLMDKNEKNKVMNDFFKSQWQLCKDKPNIFENETLLNNVLHTVFSKEIFASYQIDFLKVIKIINELIKSFLNYLYLLPYSVKCICKMIFSLIKKKFPDLTLAEYNAFIAKFFFNKLFSPVFENPGTWALINNFIISGVTKHNLKIVSFLVKKIFSLKLFMGESGLGDYTPFNWYIIDHVPEIYQFFENIIQVKLPSFLDKFLDDKLNSSYEYDYFKENPEEGIFHISICFSIKDLLAVLRNMKNLKNELFSGNNNRYNMLEKSLEKLINVRNNKILEDIDKDVQYEIIKNYDPKKKKELKETKGKPILQYILLTDLLTNKIYSKIFKINNENCFTLQEIKNTKNSNDTPKLNVIKIKNFIYKLLNNYRTLVKTEFVEGSTNNTVKILKELKEYMKISNFVIDGNIPSQWYVDSLLEYLKKIPKDLEHNDYSNLYKEITTNVNASIKDLDFEALSVVLSTVKFAKRSAIYYKKMKASLIDLELNEKVQNIIDTAQISVELEFEYSSKTKELKIEKSNQKDIKLESLESIDDVKLEGEVKMAVFCRTINAFTKRFPNISKYQQIMEKGDKNLMDIENDFKITNKLNNYFNIIREYLCSKNSCIYNLIGFKEFEDISDKIYDFVMEKLYDKLMPKDPDPIDITIYNKCKLVSWIEPKDIISSKINYVFDSFLPDVINYFNEIEKQKSPRQKIIYMTKIFQSISNVVKFSGGSEIGVDDSLDILNYALIKAQPTYMHSNCNYMNLFIGDKKVKEEGLQLIQLFAACEFVEKISADKMNGIDNDQFLRRCNTYNN